LNAREIGLLIPLLALMLFMGVYPRPFLDRSRDSIEVVRQQVATPGGGGSIAERLSVTNK
jgi:NADH-quinone oxidoreductase subunit M